MSADTDHRNAFRRRLQATLDAARADQGLPPLFGEAKAQTAVDPTSIITDALAQGSRS